MVRSCRLLAALKPAAQAALLLSAAVALSGCGRLAEQIDAATAPPQPPAAATAPAETAPATPLPSSPTPTPALPSAAPPPPAPGGEAPPGGEKTPAPQETRQLFLTRNQQTLPAEVQQACSLLLTAAVAERLPADEAGACVESSMRAGTGAVQVLSTRATGLPAGDHTAVLSTAPEFGLDLRNEKYGLQIVVADGGGYLLTPGGGVAADPDGGPEERFAAVLVEAASATADPAALGSLMAASGEFLVQAGAERNGLLYTRLTAISGPELQGVRMTTFELWLDEMLRPAYLSFRGSENEIVTTAEAAFSEWGTPREIQPPALVQLGGLR